MTEEKPTVSNSDQTVELSESDRIAASPPAAAAPEEPSPAAVEPPPPPPEPMTPERAEAENRRNDFFIMAAVMVTAFLLAAFKITDAELWLRLKAGWQIDQQGIPSRDSFAYTTEDQTWVNPHWLFDWGLYRLELIESRMRVRRLVTDYQALLSRAETPSDDLAATDTQPINAEKRRELEQQISQLSDTTRTSDTHQMRVAAERTSELVRAASIDTPQGSQDSDRAIYPHLAAYDKAGGETLIQFVSAVVIKGVVLLAMAGVLLWVRHPGPTRWWAAVVTALALVGMSDHFGLSPKVVSLLFLAITFWALHSYQTGRTWAVWLLIPVQLLWVQIDAMFPLGFVLVGIVLVGQVLSRAMGRAGAVGSPSAPTMLAGAFALSLVATMANPYGLKVWSGPYNWVRLVLGRADYVAAQAASLFGGESEWIKEAQTRGNDLLTLAPDMLTPLSRIYMQFLEGLLIPQLAAVLTMVAAFLSFLLNRRRFQLSRLLILLLCTGMFLFAFRYEAIAVLAAGVILSLNGQEWFLDRYGTETRITRGWLIWSQAGRALTVFSVVAVAIVGITGWLGSVSRGEFGFGIQWVKYDFGVGKFLRDAELKGNVLNTVPMQGNLLVWSNYPAKQVYLDGRVPLHMDRLSTFESLKIALRDDDKDVWKSELDRFGVSHVVLNITNIADSVVFLRTFAKMRSSPDWRLVHLSSNSAIFGRVDFPDDHALASDAAWFKKNAFDAAQLVYARKSGRLPEPPGPVSPPTWIDWLWQTRRVVAPQAIVAQHYLNPSITPEPTEKEAPTGPFFVVPTENCFLAIRSARQALAEETRVSPHSYAMLSKAYYYLYNTERLLAPAQEIHDVRSLQLVTALNQLVAAKPDDPIAQLQLSLRYRVMQVVDLADRHLDAVIGLLPDDARIENFLFDGGHMLNLTMDDLKRESEGLKNELDRIQYDMEQLSTQLPNPVAKANYYMGRGCPGKAIEQLQEAAAFSIGVDVSPMLARAYLRIGQPGDTDHGADREMVNMQGSGGMRPGEKEELWALIKLMQGDYDRARLYMEAAIAETRVSMAKESLMTATNDLRLGSLLSLAFAPINTIDDMDRVIRMEHHLGLIHLEAGEPGEAAKHFKQALAIRQDIPYRPVVGFYLEKITGEKLEPLPEPPQEEEDRPAGDQSLPGTKPGEPVGPAELPPKPSESQSAPNN